MVDKQIQQLIERVIDSPLKLQLLLLFCDHRRCEGTPSQLAQRTYRDIWSTREALRELLDDGVLACKPTNGEPVYFFRPRAELQEAIQRLYRVYNEPTERDALHRLIRDAETFAPYRRSTSTSFHEQLGQAV